MGRIVTTEELFGPGKSDIDGQTSFGGRQKRIVTTEELFGTANPKIAPEPEPERLIADRYREEDLARKFIPQFTKGLYESDLGRYSRGMIEKLPNSETIREVQEGTPSPRGPLAIAARLAGNILPYSALSTPFIGGAGLIPKITTLARTSVGIGAYEGTKKLIEGKPQEAPLAAAGGAALTYGGGKALSFVGKGLQKATGVMSETQLNKNIDQLISKSIRPTVTGKRSEALASKYYDRARDAVKTIIEQKDRLFFEDDLGRQVKRLPRSLRDFSSAIDQAKQNIYKQYNELAKSAGGKGVSVDLDSIADDIARQASDKSVTTLHPELTNYALGVAERFKAAKSFTPEQAQRAMEMLNNTLKAYYKNPNPQAAGRVVVDAAIASKLRNALDDAIEGATGGTYKVLKNKYGALRAIQEDVTKRAIVDARKNTKGFFDLADVFSTGDIVKGLATFNPAEIAKGTAQRGVIAFFKSLNDPNNVVKNMFKMVDRAYKPTKAVPAAIKSVRQLEGPAPKGLLEGPKPSKSLGVTNMAGEGFERVSPQEAAARIGARTKQVVDAVSQRKALPAPEEFERVSPQEAMKRLKEFAFKYYSPKARKIEIPENVIFGTKAKTILKGMGIDPLTGRLKEGPLKTALQKGLQAAKRQGKN